MTALLRAGLFILALATAVSAVGAAWEGGPWHMTGWLSPQDAAGVTTVVGLLLMLTVQLMTPAGGRARGTGRRARLVLLHRARAARHTLPARTRCLRPSPPGSTTTWRTS